MVVSSALWSTGGGILVGVHMPDDEVAFGRGLFGVLRSDGSLLLLPSSLLMPLCSFLDFLPRFKGTLPIVLLDSLKLKLARRDG